MTPKNIEEIILKNRSNKENEFLQYILNNNNGKLSDNSGYRLYECPICKTLHRRFHLEVTYNKNDLFVKQYNCSKCKSFLVVLPEKIELSKYFCKKCGEKELQEFFGYTMWD